MALISMPDAVSFYDAKGPALGMHAQPNAYFMDRVRGA
jgi:hypothetical protein